MPMINNSVSIIQKWLNSGGDLSKLLDGYKGESIKEIIEEINKKAESNITRLSELIDDITQQNYDANSPSPQSGKAVAEAIAKLLGSAPENLDTLEELAKALNEDENFSATVLAKLATKADAKTEKGGFIGGVEAVTTSGGAIGYKAKSSNGGAVGYYAQTGSGGAVGGGAKSGTGGAVGTNAQTESGGAVGSGAKSKYGGAVGIDTQTSDGGSIGYSAKSGNGFSGGFGAKVSTDSNGNYKDAIQLGTGTNNKPQTLQVYDYTMMNEDGSIPEERLPILKTLATKADTDSLKYYDDPDIVPTDASYFEYTDNGDGTCKITKLIDKTLTDVVVPYEINGLKVTNMGTTFYQCTSLTSIILPNTITSMGTTFYQCTSLTSIILPNTITRIGASAFKESAIVSITIPNSVTSIGTQAFCNCKSLTSITMSSSIEAIEKETFWDCSKLVSITIPNGVTSIGNYAFCDCSSLVSIDIPNSVTSIGNYAFVRCNKLQSVNIPNSVISIGTWAFRDCPLSIIYCDKGSVAESYAIENNIPYEYINSKDYIGEISELNTDNKETVVGAINELAGKLISETDVDSKIAAMVDSAPETLDILNELATALGDDTNFATTVATEIGKKADAKTEKGGFIGGIEAVTTSGGAIGYKAKSSDGGAIGWSAKAGIGFSGGSNATVGKDSEDNYIDAIQLGKGTNYNPKTLQIYEHTLMNEDGTIPEERLTKVKDYIDEKIGDIETALDTIIAMQNELIGVEEGGGEA